MLGARRRRNALHPARQQKADTNKSGADQTDSYDS